MQKPQHILTNEALEQQSQRRAKQGVFYPEFSDSIIEIGDDAFILFTHPNHKVVDHLTIPDRVTKIGARALANCAWLRSISLPRRLEVIEVSTFCRCNNLEHVEFPEELKCIGVTAFLCCGFKTIMLPNKLERLGFNTFCGCRYLEAVFIPESLKEIKKGAFGFCNFLNLVVTDNAWLLNADTAQRAQLGFQPGVKIQTTGEFFASSEAQDLVNKFNDLYKFELSKAQKVFLWFNKHRLHELTLSELKQYFSDAPIKLLELFNHPLWFKKIKNIQDSSQVLKKITLVVKGVTKGSYSEDFGQVFSESKYFNIKHIGDISRELLRMCATLKQVAKLDFDKSSAAIEHRKQLDEAQNTNNIFSTAAKTQGMFSKDNTINTNKTDLGNAS